MEQIIDVDGVAVHIEGQGAETIVMLHGWPDTLRLWDGQVRALSGQYRCVRFTLPGFDLAKPRRPMSLDDTVALIERVVRAASPDGSVILLQHDWGSVFGNQFALKHPELVSRIVSVDVGDALSPAFAEQLGLGAKLMTVYYQVWLALAWWIGGWFGDGMSRMMAKALKCPVEPRAIGSQMNYPYFITWFGAYGGYRGASPDMASCRTLYIYGTRKPFMFHTRTWLARLEQAPGSKTLAMKTGHWPMCQQPAEFNAAVLDWLASGRASSLAT